MHTNPARNHLYQVRQNNVKILEKTDAYDILFSNFQACGPGN